MKRHGIMLPIGVSVLLLIAGAFWTIHSRQSPNDRRNIVAPTSGPPVVEKSFSPSKPSPQNPSAPASALAGASTSGSDIPKIISGDSEQQELASRSLFFAEHTAALLKWRPYDEVRLEMEKQYPDQSGTSVESVLDEAKSLIDEFWITGDLGNPEGWKSIYKARFWLSGRWRPAETQTSASGPCLKIA